MRHSLMTCAALALAATALGACDDDAMPSAPAKTATATQCVAAQPVCAPAKTATRSASAGSSAAVTKQATGHSARTGARHARNTRSYGAARRYARVEHYGYQGGYSGGHQLSEDAYATGQTMGQTGGVRRSVRYSESSSSRSSSSSQVSGYAGGGYASSGYAGGYRQSGAWASGGSRHHEGRVVIRGQNGQPDTWTWRTAGRDRDGYLTWPGKSPD